MVHVKVPATTANIGAGFDSMGMAFQLYNHVWAAEAESGLTIVNKSNPDMPLNESNLIYQTMARFYAETGRREPDGLIIEQEGAIPPAKGLGSSAACIVGGLLAANALCKSPLSTAELVDMAAAIETHPDNSTPAIVGGFTVCAMNGGRVEYVKVGSHKMVQDGLRFAVLTPDFILPTAEARAALPERYPRADLVFNVSRAALTVAALMSGAYDKLTAAIDDRAHQPYRSKLIPGMDGIFEQAKSSGARAAFLSGAGPSLVVLYEDERTARALKTYITTLPNRWGFTALAPDDMGAVVKEEHGGYATC